MIMGGHEASLTFFFLVLPQSPNRLSSQDLNRMYVFLTSAVFSQPRNKPGKSPCVQSFPSLLQIFHQF